MPHASILLFGLLFRCQQGLATVGTVVQILPIDGCMSGFDHGLVDVAILIDNCNGASEAIAFYWYNLHLRSWRNQMGEMFGGRLATGLAAFGSIDTGESDALVVLGEEGVAIFNSFYDDGGLRCGGTWYEQQSHGE